MHYDRNNKWNWTITFLAMPIKPTRIHRNSVSIKSFIEKQFQKFSNNVVGQGIHLIYDKIRNVF